MPGEPSVPVPITSCRRPSAPTTSRVWVETTLGGEAACAVAPVAVHSRWEPSQWPRTMPKADRTMMESEDLSVFMAAIYQAARFILALVFVAVLATSTSAEPTWVLWEESNEMRAFARNPLNRVHA